MGQGSDTAMAQIVGEVLNVPAESVNVVPRDTDVTPYDMGTLGSRSLFHMGHAVQLAAEEARAKIAAMARELGLPDGTNYSIADLFQKKYGMQAGNIVGTGAYKPDYVPPQPGTGLTANVTPFWMMSGVGAEVEVDTETGHVRIIRSSTSATSASRSTRTSASRRFPAPRSCSSASPCSRRCSSTAARSPMRRSPTTRSPASTTCPDMMENETIDSYQRNGPFGGKGVGEVATFCVSPAIGNAIDDAIGVRLTELPLNPEAVLRALRAKEGRPLRES